MNTDIPSKDLDLKDKRILKELFEDGRMPFSTVAKKVGLSREVVKYRVDRLLERKFLLGFNTVIDINKIGWKIFFGYIRLRSLSSDKEKEIIKYFTNHPNIAQVIRCIGNYDIIIKIFAKDVLHMNEVIKDIESNLKPCLDEYCVDYVEEEFPIPLVLMYAPVKPDIKYMFEKKNKDKVDVDDADIKIIKLLANNARMPLIEMARKTGLSRDHLKYHLKKLEQKKVILKYRPSAWLGSISTGFSWFFVMLKIEKLSDNVRKKLQNYLISNSNITYYYKTIGAYDICFEIRLVKSGHALANTLSEIREILGDNLKRHELSIILKEEKYTYFTDCMESKDIVKKIR